MKLLMITGDTGLVHGKMGAFYNTLEEFHKYWERVDIICPRVKSKKLKVESFFGNVFIHPSPWPKIFQPFWIFREGFWILKTHNYSLETKNYLMTVHEYPPFYNGIGAKFLHFITKVPYILELMHIPGYPRSASLKESLYKFLEKIFISWDAKSARAVRVINKNQTPQFLIKAGVPRNKIKYIPAMYIDLDIFHPYEIDKKYDLVYVGRLEKNKGIQLLLEAIKFPISNFQFPIKCLIVGSGPLKESLKLKIKSLNLEKHIHFSGWLESPEDVAKAYCSAKIFVNPALNEGGPRVVFEAMACGLPIITTPVGIMPDVIKDGENGIITGFSAQEISKNILRLLNNKELQDKFSKEGVELAREFEKSKMIRNYADALKEIIKQKKILILTQKVDINDQLLGFFIRWLELLSQKFSNITVLCLEKGDFNLPENVRIISLGKDKGASKLKQLFTFYFLLFTLDNDYDSVFVHMNPIWMILGGWLWGIRNKKRILWYTSGGVTLKLRLAEKFSDMIFTASRESFRLKSDKVIVTGHGIDTELFKPLTNDQRPMANDGDKKIKIINVGRISPTKNFNALVDAAKILKDRGIEFSVTIIGETALGKDKKYQEDIKSKIKNIGLSDCFHFLGKVNNHELPPYYQSNDMFIHLSKTGSLDKTILEAMACGMNVLSSNDASKSFLPKEFIFDDSNPEELADKIIKLKEVEAPPILREYVVANHNLKNLINKISEKIS